MGVEPGGALVRIDVEGAFRQARNVGAEELAAEREDKAIVGKDLVSARGLDRHRLSDQVDISHVSRNAPDTDRVEHLLERNPDRREVRLVIAHADVVEAVAVDQRHRHGRGTLAQLIALPRRSHGTPESRKAASQDYDSLREHDVLLRPQAGFTHQLANGCHGAVDFLEGVIDMR